MELRDERALDHGSAARVIEHVLTIFRGHLRGHRAGWVDVYGRRFPLVDAGEFNIVLRTPFQHVDIVRPPGCGRAREGGTYGVDLFAGSKVFSARWDAAGARVDLLAPGAWQAQLTRMAQATMSTAAEIALRLATVRAAHAHSYVAGSGRGDDSARWQGPVATSDPAEKTRVPANAGPGAAR